MCRSLSPQRCESGHHIHPLTANTSRSKLVHPCTDGWMHLSLHHAAGEATALKDAAATVGERDMADELELTKHNLVSFSGMWHTLWGADLFCMITSLGPRLWIHVCSSVPVWCGDAGSR